MPLTDDAGALGTYAAAVSPAVMPVEGDDPVAALDPGRLVPTVGATGGISLLCSLFERAGRPVAYITDAPTYAGFLARSALSQFATIFSVDLDASKHSFCRSTSF